MTNFPKNHKFIFIGGLHKSGTSLLRKCLLDHSRISGFQNTGAPQDEGQHLQSIYLPAKAFGGPGIFGFHPQAHLTETSPLVSADSAQTIFAEWSKYWDLEKEYLLEKSPPNLIWTRFLQALFPNSYQIIILRHPIAVAMATRRWIKVPLKNLLDHWLVCHQLFDQDRIFIQNLLVIKYETLVSAPKQTLREIYDFLELEEVDCQEKVGASINQDYFRQLYQHNHSPFSRISLIANMCSYEKRVNKFGYSMLQPNAIKGYPR